jgi:hypothetical protein
MRFYTRTHKHYCGIDLHARSMYVGETSAPAPSDAAACGLRRTRRLSLDKCWVQSSLRTAWTETKPENGQLPRFSRRLLSARVTGAQGRFVYLTTGGLISVRPSRGLSLTQQPRE